MMHRNSNTKLFTHSCECRSPIYASM